MIPFNRLKFKSCAFGLLISISSLAQQDLRSYSNSLSFARYLVRTQQYEFASQEYERLNFIWPGDTTVMLELTQTYRLNGDCTQFQNAFDLLSSRNRLYENHEFAREYLRFCLTCDLKHPSYFPVMIQLPQEEKVSYSLGFYLATQQYDSAFSYRARHMDLLSTVSPQLSDITRDFEMRKTKKPWLAMAMSAVIPGSGKAYSGRWGDASISLLFVASSAFASYRAFKKKGVQSFNGWIFGGIALSFYSSNIYGSHKAARRYNEDQRNHFHQHAKSIIYSAY
jgi:hypothetical protein